MKGEGEKYQSLKRGSRELRRGNLSRLMATEHGIPTTQDLSNNPIGLRRYAQGKG
jgi:hypothetical protein